MRMDIRLLVRAVLLAVLVAGCGGGPPAGETRRAEEAVDVDQALAQVVEELPTVTRLDQAQAALAETAKLDGRLLVVKLQPVNPARRKMNTVFQVGDLASEVHADDETWTSDSGLSISGGYYRPGGDEGENEQVWVVRRDVKLAGQDYQLEAYWKPRD